MEFKTKIVKGNKNPKARITWAGAALLFLAMVLACMDGYERYGFALFGVAAVVLITGAILSKGDVAAIVVTDVDLVISSANILIGETKYTISTITELVFHVEGYDGMIDPDGYAPGTTSRRRGHLNGMNNYVNFSSGGEKMEWQFYLPDPLHVQQLGALFKELYAGHIPFVERSLTSDRTFLFEPVTKKEWEDRMIEYGYEYDHNPQ